MIRLFDFPRISGFSATYIKKAIKELKIERISGKNSLNKTIYFITKEDAEKIIAKRSKKVDLEIEWKDPPEDKEVPERFPENREHGMYHRISHYSMMKYCSR